MKRRKPLCVSGQTGDGTPIPSEQPAYVRDQAPPARCYRLPVFPVQCRSDAAPSTRSWFYDPVSAKCRQLPLVGCSLIGDSENSFDTLEECRVVCQVKPIGKCFV
jgi:Kunitz/Bovine pancreatic trypsin inhibitor domain